MVGDLINSVSIALTAIAGAVVLLRLITRIVVTKKSGLDDFWIGLAMVFSLGLTISVLDSVRNGLGTHMSGLKPKTITRLLKSTWISLIAYGLTLTCIKISILVLYLRIFPSRRFRIACTCLLVFVIGYGIWVVLGGVFMCTPVSFFWNRSIPGGHCPLDRFWIFYMNAAVNITQEFVILLLPMPLLGRLHLLRGQKIALIGMFALGGFVSIICIIRIVNVATVRHSDDQSYDTAMVTLYSTVEVNVALVCACLPVLRPLFAHLIPDFTSTAARQVRGCHVDEENCGFSDQDKRWKWVDEWMRLHDYKQTDAARNEST